MLRRPKHSKIEVVAPREEEGAYCKSQEWRGSVAYRGRGLGGSNPPPKFRNFDKVPKIKKILLYEMKFVVLNYSCLQNPWLGGHCPQIPVLSVLNWICWTPPPNKIPGYATDVISQKTIIFLIFTSSLSRMKAVVGCIMKITLTTCRVEGEHTYDISVCKL
jgi:hypothetical protein